MVKKILILLLLVLVGQLVALSFWYFFNFDEKLAFPAMGGCSVFLWILYLQQNKDNKTN
jgi:hypothetical protein